MAGDSLAAFALIGDRYHNSDYIRAALNKTLGEGLGLGIDFTDETRALDAEALGGRRLLIVFRDAALWPNGYGADSFWPGEHHRRPETDPFEIKASSWYEGYQAYQPIEVEWAEIPISRDCWQTSVERGTCQLPRTLFVWWMRHTGEWGLGSGR